MRQVRESVEINRPPDEVSAMWSRAGQPDDQVAFEDLGGRTRLTVVRSEPDPGFIERMVDVAVNAEGADLRAELERFRIDCEAALPTGRGREVGTGAGGGAMGGSATGQGDTGNLGGTVAADAVDQPADNMAALDSGVGRGRGSAMPDAAGASQAGGGTGGTEGRNLGVGVGGTVTTPSTLREGVATPPIAGGVAVNQGRGSDLGTTGGGVAGEREGMGGGSFGGSRESDIGPGLNNGMRGGHGVDVDGATGQTLEGPDARQLRGEQERPREKGEDGKDDRQ